MKSKNRYVMYILSIHPPSILILGNQGFAQTVFPIFPTADTLPCSFFPVTKKYYILTYQCPWFPLAVMSSRVVGLVNWLEAVLRGTPGASLVPPSNLSPISFSEITKKILTFFSEQTTISVNEDAG